MKGYGDMGGKMRAPNRLFAIGRINPPTVSPVTFSRREPVAFKLPQKHAKIKKAWLKMEFISPENRLRKES